MRVSKAFEIDAAHFIPGHPGKCANMHGHRWTVVVEVKGQINAETGMVIDFGDLKKFVEPLIAQLDHHTLNDVLPIAPTAENIAKWFADTLRPVLSVSKVEVWETPTSCAEWRREEDGL